MKPKRGGCPVKRSRDSSGSLGRTVEDEELRLGGPLEAFIGFGQNVFGKKGKQYATWCNWGRWYMEGNN